MIVMPAPANTRAQVYKRDEWQPSKTRAVIPYPRIGKRRVLGRSDMNMDSQGYVMIDKF